LHVGTWMLRAAKPVVALLLVAAVARLAGWSAIPDAALVPLLPALVLIPTGMLAANKFGGNENSFHSFYFLLASAVALLVSERPGQARTLSRAAAHMVCVVGAFVAWRYGYTKLHSAAPTAVANPHQQAYDCARAH